MEETTTVADSSPAVPVGADWDTFRVTGKIPEPEPRSEAAPQVEAGEATPPKQQEERRRRPDAEARIKELAAETKRLKAELEDMRKPKEPVKQEPQYTRPKPTIHDKNPDGSPKYKEYDDFTEELADWKAEQRVADYERKKLAEAQQAEVQKRVNEAKSRYENFDEYAQPFVKEMLDSKDIPLPVKVMVSESEVWPDLVFTIASNAEDRAEFLQLAKTQPGKALRYIAKVESLIQEELSVPRGTSRGEDGKFTSEPKPPAKRGPESAPEPPLEVGNRGTGTMDESGRALSALERGNPNAVRDWLKAENAKDLRRRRGV